MAVTLAQAKLNIQDALQTIACNVMLSILGCATLSDVTMTVVTTFGGFATGGYFALSGVRDCSRNKYHMEGIGDSQ